MPPFDPVTLAIFIAAPVALYLTPGAGTIFTGASDAVGGRRAGVAAALGASIGALAHKALAVAGAATLIAFGRGAVTNLLNPKVAVSVLAFPAKFIGPAIGPVWIRIAWLGTVFSLAAIPFSAAHGLLPAVLANRVRRAGRWMSRLSALVFGGLAARLVSE